MYYRGIYNLIAGDEDVRDFLKYVNGELSDNPFVKELEQEIREETAVEITKRDMKVYVESLKFFNIPNDAIVEQLIKNYHLTKDEAKAYVKMTD